MSFDISEYDLVEITSISEIGEEETFDISVDMGDSAFEPCFFANGILVHNCQNYMIFFNKKITKKDPRRQDAKTAVFSVSYGAKEGSVARKMKEEVLTALEDKLFNGNDLPEEEKKALRKKIAYLKTEEADKEYLQQAKDLLEVLSQKWGGLTDYINEMNENTAKTHVLFGPHGRPRHLWGHSSPDRFAKYAMDRRGFNSASQGFASDIGFVSIYLFNRTKFELFDSRGLKTDIMSCNAVHDSAMADMHFRFLPLYTYLQEHSMITIAEEYYKRIFGITAHTKYGFDLEAGIHEAEMTEWNKRPADLPTFVETIGKKLEMPTALFESVLEDAHTIGALRLKELKSNHQGYIFSLENENTYQRIVPKLNCFKEIN
jgi:hypothetical protein